MMAALALGLVAFGTCWALLPLLNRESVPARCVMIGVSFVLLGRYFVWRITQTLPPPGWTADFLVGYPFMLVEAASMLSVFLSMLFLIRTINRTGEVEAALRASTVSPGPLVDIFICTYNEEKPILERTIIGATGINYDNCRVGIG